MKPRDFLNFFKTRSGKLVLFGVVFGDGLVVFSALRDKSGSDEIRVTGLTTNATDRPQVVESIERQMQPFRPPPPKTNAPPSLPPKAAESPKVVEKPKPEPPPPQLPSLSLFADVSAGVPEPESLGEIYAPFGRLIPCETVITVDSASIQTPIVGLITENISLNINVPELMQIFRQSADVQTAAILNLPRPKLDGEKPAVRNAPATPELKEFVQELAKRAERPKTNRVDPSEDNMLKITSEGRKAALDLRLMKPSAPDDPQGKVNQAVENIFRIWQDSKPERSAQLVFCDLSTPKDKVYRYVTEGSFDAYMWQTLETKVGAHFEREERYQQLTRRQSEIEEKLDLTKNQAPGQVEAEPGESVDQKNSERNSQRNHKPHRAHRTAIHA